MKHEQDIYLTRPSLLDDLGVLVTAMLDVCNVLDSKEG